VTLPISGRELHLVGVSSAQQSTRTPRVGAPGAPGLAEVTVETVAEPVAEQRLGRLWKVICHDDPHTTMDFVVEVLMTVFRQPSPRAFELMLCVHHAGSAWVGSWPESVARKKVAKAQAKARMDGFPLTFSVEVDD
jgi:ATP-dependent Clp protease adaptor protein ClpS